MEAYTRSHKPLDFFIDLMSLTLSPSEKFKNDLMKFLQSYISSSALQLKENPERLFVSYYVSILLLLYYLLQ